MKAIYKQTGSVNIAVIPSCADDGTFYFIHWHTGKQATGHYGIEEVKKDSFSGRIEPKRTILDIFY